MGKSWREEIFEPLNLTLLAASGKLQTENSPNGWFQTFLPIKLKCTNDFLPNFETNQLSGKNPRVPYPGYG